MAVPDDLKDRELHQVHEVLADLTIVAHPLDIMLVDPGERGIVDTHAAKLHLQLDKLGEVRHVLRLARVQELDGREDQAPGDGERAESLEDDLEQLKVHARNSRVKLGLIDTTSRAQHDEDTAIGATRSSARDPLVRAVC